VAEELGSWVRTAFKLAGSMHKNCYENLATRETWRTRWAR
jgi:hypothetical protein